VTLKHFTQSLRFKITLLVIAVELLILAGVGVFYTRLFSQEIDEAIIARLSIPGLLMTRGELSFDAVSDTRTMEGLLREPYIEGIVIGLDGHVYYSSDPARLDTHLDAIDGVRLPGPESSALSADAPDLIAPVQDSHRTYLTSLSPLRPNGKLAGYLYLKVGTGVSGAEKRKISILFAIGTLGTILLTASMLSWLLHLMVTSRLNFLVGIFRRFAQGDYAVRAQPLVGIDEITTLMNGFDALAKRLEDAMAHLSESESRFRVLVEHAPEAILVYDVDTKHFVDANRNAERLFACSRGQLRLASLTAHVPVQTDKMAAGQNIDEYSSRVLAGEEVVVERAITDPIGQQVLCDVRLVRLPASNRRLIRASYIDITARKHAEDELRRLTLFQRTILNSAAYAIISATPAGIVTGFNPAAERLLGYAADEVVGKQTPALWHDPLEVERYALMLSRELGEKVQPGFDVFTARPKRNLPEENEWTYIRKDGRRIPVILSVTALRSEGGIAAGFVGLIYDLTERKRAEEELRRYKEQLEDKVRLRTAELISARDAAEAANRAKSVFLANMSHELRTPLNAILGFSSLMRHKPEVTANQQETLAIINRSGEYLLRLINDILEMAKIEAGRLELGMTPFDLGAMVRDVVGMMRLRAEEKGLRLQLEQSSAFPRYIKGDEARLRQILVNLASNALKFTKEGGVTIRLGLRSDGGPHLLIEVEDTGIGITPEDQKRLFHPFVQFGETGERMGTGLGLAITRQLAELMGGSIGVDSTLGKGSIFRIRLPVELAAAADVVPPKARAWDVCGLAPGQPQFRILIAEDQRENQLLLMKLMTDIGLDTRLAENGQECVKLFQSWHPHLIWMDRRMPVMDGVEATHRIRELPGGNGVKIVAVTASAFKEQRQELLNAGLDDFVRKPYRIHEIYDCMAWHLGLKYVYRSSSPGAEAGAPAALTPAMLAVLPAALREKLRDALGSLDSKRIRALIQQGGEADPNLGRALTRLAENFDYAAIRKALESQTR
jgi:PAS domain S-box-containing protein